MQDRAPLPAGTYRFRKGELVPAWLGNWSAYANRAIFGADTEVRAEEDGRISMRQTGKGKAAIILTGLKVSGPGQPP